MTCGRCTTNLGVPEKNMFYSYGKQDWSVHFYVISSNGLFPYLQGFFEVV